MTMAISPIDPRAFVQYIVSTDGGLLLPSVTMEIAAAGSADAVRHTISKREHDADQAQQQACRVPGERAHQCKQLLFH